MKKIEKVKLRCKNLFKNWKICLFINFVVFIILQLFFENNIYLKENLIIFGIYTLIFITLILRNWYLYWLRKNCNHINNTGKFCYSCGKKLN